jgi:2,5-furandicarboxylate decarboxylase 1
MRPEEQLGTVTGSAHGVDSLRDYLRVLEENRELRRVKDEVNAKFEIAAIHMKVQSERGPALLFENVKGFDMPVLVNLLSSRRRLALCLGLAADTNIETLDKVISERMRNEVNVDVVSTGPCKEVILDSSRVNLTKYPIMTMHEKDAGPYITGAFIVAKDPETGIQNLSYHRLLLKSRNRLGILMEPRHLWSIYRKADSMNEPLKIAIVIGYNPLVGMAAATGLPIGRNEYALAGALAAHPIELVKAEDSDLLVPANAEIVMEGVVLPKVREKEAPYGEYTGYYGNAAMRPVVEVQKITQRKDPIYYSITARSSEVGYYFIAKTIRTLERIRESVPSVKSANFLQTFFYAISLKKEHEGDGRKAMLAAITANDSIKYCVAVDDDVNTRSPEEVLWAIATRCDPAKDTFIIPRTFGQTLDPSAEGEDESRVWSLLCIDATRPIVKPFAERSRIPTLEDVERMKHQGLL